MNRVPVNLTVPAAELLSVGAYGAGALIRLERAAVEAGPFTEHATQALVAGIDSYVFWDDAASTSWYRARFSDAAGTKFSGYGNVFQVGTQTAYATLADLREYLGLPNSRQDNLLLDLLDDATAWLTERCGRSFFRSPQVTGTEARTFSIDGSSRTLTVDLVSVTLVEAAAGTGQAYATIAATDYELQPNNPDPGWPYEDLVLNDVATRYQAWPTGFRTVRITGVFGWPEVPGLIRRATLDLAREMFFQGVGGRTVGVEFGRLPISVTDAIDRFSRRSWSYV